jgi:sialic acid synthase SpsE
VNLPPIRYVVCTGTPMIILISMADVNEIQEAIDAAPVAGVK